MEFSGQDELRKQIELINRIAKGEPHPMRPEVRITNAAIDLWKHMKDWSNDTRKMIDAFDHRASGNLGDFLIAMDEVIRSVK